VAEVLLLQGGILVAADGLQRADLLVIDGTIRERKEHIAAPAAATVLDCEGALVGPGLVDLHTHLREPGGEEAETVASGARAAALGGYTAVLAMPNTEPAIDCAAVVAQVLSLGQAAVIDVAVAGAITVGRAGTRLSPMAEMAALGVTLFTDDGQGVQDAGLMRRAMEYARGLDVTLAEHCEDESLAQGGSMNEGSLSARLGLTGRPALAEEAMVARDIALAELSGCSLHLLHLSTARSAELVAVAKAQGIGVTAEVTPHHLILDESCCADFDPIFKVHPPLRQPDDVAALRRGLLDGSIDAIATDHAPHPPESKDRPFDDAAPGMLGLQSALALSVEALGGADADPCRVFELLSRGPARISRLRSLDARLGGQSAQGGDLVIGEDANLCVFDPSARPVVEASGLASLAKNSPYLGRTLLGGVRHTVASGRAVVVDGRLC